MMKTIQEVENEIIENFSMYEEWLDKYEYLIDLGKNLEPYPEEARTEDKLIKGCQSRVWLDAHMQDGRLWFKADSDAIIVKGIISMLVREQIGLKENLSPTRANGLVSMIETIRKTAEENV